MKRLIGPAVFALACLLAAAPAARAAKEKELFKTKASMAFVTPDGQLVAAAGNNNVRVINHAAKKASVLVKMYQMIGLSPDGKTLATVGRLSEDEELVSLFETATGKAGASFPVPSQGLLTFALSPDAKTFAHGTL